MGVSAATAPLRAKGSTRQRSLRRPRRLLIGDEWIPRDTQLKSDARLGPQRRFSGLNSRESPANVGNPEWPAPGRSSLNVLQIGTIRAISSPESQEAAGSSPASSIHEVLESRVESRPADSSYPYSSTITNGQSVRAPALFSMLAANVPLLVLLSEMCMVDGEALGAWKGVATASPPTVPLNLIS